MKKRTSATRILLAIILPMAISFTSYAQSPWVREKGSGYLQFSYNVIPEYESVIEGGSNSQSTARRVQDKTLQLYGEYGLFKNTSVILNLPYKFTATGDTASEAMQPILANRGSLSGFSNIQLAVRQKIWEGDYILSAQLKAELPTADFDDSTGLRTGYDALAINPILSVGRGWGSVYGYAYGGTRFSGNNYSTYLTFGAEVGLKVGEGFWFVVLTDIFQSLEDGDRFDPVENQQTALYVNDQEYVSIGLKLLGDIKKDKLGFSVSSTGALSGNQVARSPSINLGVYWKW